MAHYAKVVDNEVTQVIVAEPEFFDTFVDSSPGTWIKCSYNMRGGVYYDPETNEPAADQSVIEGDDARERLNYPGTGWLYHSTEDIFSPPKPYTSWTLDASTGYWEPPVAYPNSGGPYEWNEEDQTWDETDGPT